MQILKKNRSVVFLAATVAALTLLIGTAAVASPFGGMDKRPAKMKRFLDYKVDDVLTDLDATEAQKAAAQVIVDRVFDEGLELHADKAKGKAELKAIFASDEPDAERLHALVDAKSKKMNGFAHKLADAALELHEILTPEQRDALLEEIESHHGRHGR